MKLSEIKHILKEKETIVFELPDGRLVPSHFHVTEIGGIEKKFIDWTQDDQSFNNWLKTDVFQIVATYLSSGRTSLLQDSPKT